MIREYLPASAKRQLCLSRDPSRPSAHAYKERWGKQKVGLWNDDRLVFQYAAPSKLSPPQTIDLAATISSNGRCSPFGFLDMLVQGIAHRAGTTCSGWQKMCYRAQRSNNLG